MDTKSTHFTPLIDNKRGTISNLLTKQCVISLNFCKYSADFDDNLFRSFSIAITDGAPNVIILIIGSELGNKSNKPSIIPFKPNN